MLIPAGLCNYVIWVVCRLWSARTTINQHSIHFLLDDSVITSQNCIVCAWVKLKMNKKFWSTFWPWTIEVKALVMAKLNMKAFNILQHCKPINITNGHFIVHFIAHILIHTNTICCLTTFPGICSLHCVETWWVSLAGGWGGQWERVNNTPIEIINSRQKLVPNDSWNISGWKYILLINTKYPQIMNWIQT